jgi:hypothetical protein
MYKNRRFGSATGNRYCKFLEYSSVCILDPGNPPAAPVSSTSKRQNHYLAVV